MSSWQKCNPYSIRGRRLWHTDELFVRAKKVRAVHEGQVEHMTAASAFVAMERFRQS